MNLHAHPPSPDEVPLILATPGTEWDARHANSVLGSHQKYFLYAIMAHYKHLHPTSVDAETVLRVFANSEWYRPWLPGAAKFDEWCCKRILDFAKARTDKELDLWNGTKYR